MSQKLGDKKEESTQLFFIMQINVKNQQSFYYCAG